MNKFNANKSKVNLKLASGRLKLLRQKKTTLNEQMKREIADLLGKKKEESARIKVEHVIREDFNMEAMEILELYCELLLARFGLLETMQHCDPAIAEAVNTIIYAAPRSEVKELYELRDQFVKKYGKDFAMAAQENRNDVVNNRIIAKLKVQTPDPLLVNQYLKAIAESYHVEWDGDTSNSDALVGIDSALLNPELGNAESAFQHPYTFPQQFPQQQLRPGVQYGGQQPPQQFQQQPQQQQQQYFMPPPPGNYGPPGFQQPRVPSPFGNDGYSQAGIPGQQQQPQYVDPRMQPGSSNAPPRPESPSAGLPNFPNIPTSKVGGDGNAGDDSGDLPDFDELTRRFEALKRKK
ncbi:hypothetical protein SmJEL517_g04208 [Synchytrium microbalum]|uniref:IST1 homolog n=1 Tax=Synchytrium microbalum TaxID=1806994 RepID=A0A507C3M3_9FUNG|nr:uncharacterized protein SmJEL517_g04208 [Synchytrium microbalum]TPX32704.1 hypothetical protein SmJEL517_g04208 [Synchytrium microbalum]